MLVKFKSRKFVLAIAASVLVLLNDIVDLGFESETIYGFASIVTGWILGESYVDSKRVENGVSQTKTKK